VIDGLDRERFKGQFVRVESDGSCAVVPPVAADDDGLIIFAGDWPCRFVGARRHRCDICHCFVALSPRSWEIHLENMARLIVCLGCAGVLQDLLAPLSEEQGARVLTQLREWMGKNPRA
jgi:hypothetical protein